MSAPIIGITTWHRNITTGLGDGKPTHTIGAEYADMVIRAGGVPVLLVPGTDAARVIDALDGLVMSGGEDVHPRHYGAEEDASQTYSESRDAFELELARLARERNLPTLGICRGLQVMNVALGGTLVEDIPSSQYHETVVTGEAQMHRRHPVSLIEDSALARIYGTLERQINTIHHQAVREPAADLRITGTAPDGVVEAAESTDSDWLFWGVQWHPEKMATDEELAFEHRLFSAFISAITDGE